jgi:hypothetical protein
MKKQRLSKQSLVNIYLFNSQACESLSRDARSLGSTFSTMVSLDLSFLIQHKHKREYSSILPNQLDEIDSLDIKQII